LKQCAKESGHYLQRARYMTLETISQMSDDHLVSLPAVAS
jgi:hypothetical protein